MKRNNGPNIGAQITAIATMSTTAKANLVNKKNGDSPAPTEPGGGNVILPMAGLAGTPAP